MKPLIGITSGEVQDTFHPWNTVVYGQCRSYVDSVIAAGGLPVMLPVTADGEVLSQLYAKLDGLLFSGGPDINPSLYGAQPGPVSGPYSDLMDAGESQLMAWALRDQKPVLAICRGAQLLNVVSGGTLYQDILAEVPGARNHSESSQKNDMQHIAHTLKISPSSRLADILGVETMAANTHHHQAVKDVAASLIAAAWAEDGIIEAVEGGRGRFVIGVQCHPEALAPGHASWRRLFQQFVVESARLAATV